MRIVIDARILRTSTGTYTYHLLENLQQMDRENEYIVLLLKKDFAGWQPAASNFTKQVADYPMYSFREQLQLAWQLYKLKANLVHFTFHARPILYFGKSITTVHDINLTRIKNYDMPRWIFELKQLVYKIVLHIIARQSKIILVPTRFVRHDLARYTHIALQKIRVTYEAADKLPDSPAPIEHLANKQFLLYVGQSSPYKNIRRIIEAHQSLLAAHPALHFVHAGKKDYFTEQNEKWVKKEGFKNTHFLGYVSNAQLAWLYQHAAVYVFASLEEGFGLPGLEAMHFGVPVASSNASCLPEVYRDAAEYFDPLDTGNMAATINSLLTSPKRRQELTAKGKKLLGTYSWQRMAKQTHRAYMAALSGKN